MSTPMYRRPWAWIGCGAVIMAALWALDITAWLDPAVDGAVVPGIIAGLVAVILCMVIAVVLYERQRRAPR